MLGTNRIGKEIPMTPLTDAEIAEMERLEKASTIGPWINGERITPEDNCMALQAEEHADIYRETKHGNCNVACATFEPVDADLVVALRNAAPQLLASAREANRLRAQVAMLRFALVDARHFMRPPFPEELHGRIARALSATAPEDAGGA
jgi:hypothetical protein